MNHTKRLILLGGLACGALLLGGCGGGNGNNDLSFQVSVTNLTNHQPLSPLLLALHRSNIHAWQVGEPAGEGLEILAEGGDGGVLSDELSTAGAHVTLGDAVLLPGASQTFTVRSNNRRDHQLTVATMLVNTNDETLDSTACCRRFSVP